MSEDKFPDAGTLEGIPSDKSIEVRDSLSEGTALFLNDAREELQYLKQKKLELLKEKRDVVANLPHRYGYKKYKWQREFFDSFEKDLFLTAANQTGKALRKDELIPTPQGFVELGKLVVGDKVYGRDGKTTTITHIFDVEVRPFFRITFKDGTVMEACSEHRWLTKDRLTRTKKGYSYYKGIEKPKGIYGKWTIRTTEDMYKKIEEDKLVPGKEVVKYTIPYTEAVERHKKKQPLDAWFMGVLLSFDSLQRGSRVFQSKNLWLLHRLKDFGCVVKDNYVAVPDKVLDIFNEYRFYEGNKHIPDVYLMGNIEQRKALLSGIIDAGENYIDKDFHFITKNERLFEDVKSLVFSLGGYARVCDLKNLGTRSLVIHLKEGVYNKHKFSKYKVRNSFHEKYITTIELIGLQDGRCIMVDNEDHTYLAGKDYVVTHNSTIQISTAIEWAGNKNLWPKLWGTKIPRQMWYFYPSQDLATDEFVNKWEAELLPRGKMKDDPQWGWRIEKRGSPIYAIHFNSGCSIYFKSYAQDVMKLQAATVAAIFCDEELIETYWDELNFRRIAMNGYFRMVFTATLGQQLWYDCMERIGTPQEKFPMAKKMQISLYDCMEYEDGTPSHIDELYIKKAISLCKTEAEVQKRVMGRFSVDEGLKYPSFDRQKNVMGKIQIPRNWVFYGGIDIGTGGEGHPSAIVFVAVSPDFTDAIAFAGWRGSKEEYTTDTDVLEKLNFLLEREGLVDKMAGIFYDYHAKNFGLICERKGMSVLKADKSHEVGESVLNVLFKNERLKIFDTVELHGLTEELLNLKVTTRKTKAKDDYIDALRYACSRIPFNWEKIGAQVAQPLQFNHAVQSNENIVDKERRESAVAQASGETLKNELEQELSYWGDFYEGF